MKSWYLIGVTVSSCLAPAAENFELIFSGKSFCRWVPVRIVWFLQPFESETDQLNWYSSLIGIGRFINKAYIDEIVKKSRQVHAEALVSASAGAVLAIGSYTALLREQSKPGSRALQKAYQRLLDILERHRSVRSSPDSLLKLLVCNTIVAFSGSIY